MPAMTDLADLFPGFQSHWIDTAIGRIFARSGGSGPPLLLLHGYPQTHVMWHRVAPLLARHFTLIIPDLPGYGWSVAPPPDENHDPYSKRAMAAVMVEAMERLGHVYFHVAGHDRGGRVAYRLALDHPGRVTRLAVLDIVPTWAMWRQLDRAMAFKVFHWTFLAQSYPLPETLIGQDPVRYLDWQMAQWTRTKDLSAFDPQALAHYRAFFAVPERLRATCEDYRAGYSVDYEYDDADRAAGRQIGCPVFVLWGGAGGIPGYGTDPLSLWREWAPDVIGRAIEAGHFLCEERPEATAAALLGFFKEGDS
jgi:haloacetate dehalogenase